MIDANLGSIVQLTIVIVTVIIILLVVIGAIKAGILRIDSTLHQEVKAMEKSITVGNKLIADFTNSQEDIMPYETDTLTRYYAQVLSQSKISFWFSLICAAVGFGVIVIAVFLHSDDKMATTVISLISGTVIDAVSTLFFVQSKSAQKSMSNFFDKLRNDYQQLESRKVCSSIGNSLAKDALNIQLALHFAQVGNEQEMSEFIISKCLVNEPALAATNSA